MVYSVSIVLDLWKGKQDFLVINLNDFDVITGMDFLRKAKMSLIPYLDGLMITNENCPCFVQCCKALTESASKGKKSLVSAIAIEKSL